MTLAFDVLHIWDHGELPLTVGLFLGALFTGGLITLGTVCLFLLSSASGGPHKRRRLLWVYTIALLLMVIAFELAYFLFVHIPAVFYPHSEGELNGLMYNRMLIVMNLFQVIILSMTDGLLIWRCYMVYKVFGYGPSKWRNIFWAFPACLWVVDIVTGSICVRLTGGGLGDTLLGILFTCNAVINLYGTVFIAVRLLLHRRMVKACLGNNVPTKRCLHIVGILLESAAINVPIAVATAIGNLSDIAAPSALTSIGLPSQAFSSVLIIHQFAIGRAFDRQTQGNVVPKLGEQENATRPSA